VLRIAATVAGPPCDAFRGPLAARSATSLGSLRLLGRSGDLGRPDLRRDSPHRTSTQV